MAPIWSRNQPERKCLEGFFEQLHFLGEAGQGEDVESLLERLPGLLGTQREDSWVFAAEPAVLSAARPAGFPTVGLLGEGDSQKEEQLRPLCDLMAHGYGELSLERIADYARSRAADEGSQCWLRVLLVAGSPDEPSPELLRELASSVDYVIAADRGAEPLYRAQARIDALVGDADSASAEALAWAHAAAATDIRFSSEKYATDLALAIECAKNEAARRNSRLQLTLTCCTGGRPDHALAVLGLLAQQAASCPRVVERGLEYRILSPEGAPSWTMDAPGATFSVLALREKTLVSEQGSQWELDRQPLALLDDRGISNLVGPDGCTVTCHSGIAVAYLLR